MPTRYLTPEQRARKNAHQRKALALLRAMRKASGFCGCGKRRDRSGAKCSRCVARAKDLRDRRKAAGLCNACPEKAIPGQTRCVKHAATQAARTRKLWESGDDRVRYRDAAHGARVRGIEMRLSLVEFTTVRRGGPCHWCGERQPEVGFGVDRLDSYRPYEAGNVVPCCGTCNRMKMDETPEAFLARCRRIADRWPVREGSDATKAA